MMSSIQLVLEELDSVKALIKNLHILHPMGWLEEMWGDLEDVEDPTPEQNQLIIALGVVIDTLNELEA